MGSLNKGNLSIIVALLMIATSIIIVEPAIAEDIQEEGEVIVIDTTSSPSISPPSRTIYSGTTYTVGSDVGDDSITIQGAVDMCSNGDIVSVSAGTYEEEVYVDDEIWIMGSPDVILGPLNIPVFNIGFDLDAPNVTISEFNISDFQTGVFSDYLGHNISNNAFFSNEYDIRVYVSHTDIHTSFIVEDFIVYENLFERDSNLNSVDIFISLDHDDENSTRTHPGSFLFIENYFRSITTAGEFIEFEIDVQEKMGGSLELGDLVLRGNEMYGGGLGLDFNGDNIQYLTDVDVDIGEITIVDNLIDDHDDGGLNVNYYDLMYLYGTTTVDMEDVTITDNVVSGSTESIYLSNFANWQYLYNNTSLISGNVSIERNVVNGGGNGIYVSNSYLGYELYHNVKATTKNILIRDNEIQRSGHGITIDNSGGSDLYDNSHAEIGDIHITDNYVNATYDAIEVTFSSVGANLYDDSKYYVGDLLIRGNEAHGSNIGSSYSGTKLGYEEIGYNLYNNSIVELGEILIVDNDLWGYYGINLDYFYEMGYDMEHNSVFTMDGINISSNRVRATYTGIYISEFDEIGYYLYGNANVTIGDILFEMNTIWSERYGIYVSSFEYIGYELYDNSICTISDVSFSENKVSSNSFAMYIEYIEYIGNYLYNHSLFSMGSILINNNDLRSNSTTLYIYYIYEFGSYLEDNSTFKMNNIEVNGNYIESVHEGIYVEYLGDFGYYMYNWSSFTMGDIQFNDNTIRSDYYGIYTNEITYFGYNLEERSSFEMGNIEVCGNDIISENDGMYVEYFSYFGYDIYGYSTYLMGEFIISYNDITTNGSGIYLYEIYEIGYYFYDHARGYYGGLHVDRNMIDAQFEGIYVEGLQYFGENIEGHSYYKMGNVTFNENVIRSLGDGIWIDDFCYILSDLDGNGMAYMGWFQINDNRIDSDGDGVSLLNFDNFGDSAEDDSVAMADGIQIINNTIIADSRGINMADGIGFGDSMDDNSEITMGPIIISENMIESGSKGIYFDQSQMGHNMYSGDAVMEGLFITENILYSSEGIDVRFETADLFNYVNITIDEVLIDGNEFMRTADGDAIYLRFESYTNDNSTFEIGKQVISNNLMVGANVSVIHSNQAATENGNGNSDLGTLEIFGNNITGGGTGLELEGVMNANIYVNNFIANIDDVTSGSGLMTWVSPEPMWYRFGMRNYSSYLGNYWDSYTGPDNDNDGIGDNPYNTGFGLDNKPLVRGTWELLPPWSDITPPEITIDSPEFGSFTSSENVTMTWTVTDDLLGVDSQWVRLDEGDWILKEGASEHTFTFVEEGTHQLWVKASDVAGNENMTFVNITIDMTSPDVWIVNPADGEAFNVTDIVIEFNATDALSGIASFRISLDEEEPVNVGTDLEYSLINLSEGSHTVTVSAFDGAGVEGLVEITIIVDLTAPTLEILHPTDGMVVTYDRINASWKGNGGPSGIGKYLISVDGENLTNMGMSTGKMIEDLSNGPHTLRIVCYDGAGNFVSRISEFTVNTDHPVVEITYPADGSYLNMTSFDSEWIINGMTQKMDIVEYRVDSGNWTETTMSGVAILDLVEGTHTLDVRVKDVKGAIAAATSHFTVDVTRPTVHNVSHEGASAPAVGPVVITFSEAIDHATVTLNGDPISFELVGNTITLTLENISAGTAYLFQIYAVDMAGNEFSGPVSFTTAAKGQVSGRIVDEKGDPVEGAKVVFDTGEEAITDENGEFSVAVSDGSRTAIVYDKDDEEIGTFEVDVTGGEDVVSGNQTVEPKEKEDRFPWWILVLIALLVLVLLGIVIFVLRSKGREAEEDEEDEYDDADDIWEDDEDEDDDDFDDDEDYDDEDDDEWDDE